MNNFDITNYFEHTLKKPKHFITLFDNENNQRFSKLKINKNKIYDFCEKSWPNFDNDIKNVSYNNSNIINIDDVYHNLNKYKASSKKDIRIENFNFILFNFELKNNTSSSNKRQKFNKKRKFDVSEKIKKIFLCNNNDYKILCSSHKHKESIYFYYIDYEKEKIENNVMIKINFNEVILIHDIVYYKLVKTHFYLVTTKFIYCYNLKNNNLDKIDLNNNQYLIHANKFNINENYFISYNSKTGVLVICNSYKFSNDYVKVIVIGKNLFIKITNKNQLLIMNNSKIKIYDIESILHSSFIFKKKLIFNISDKEISEFSKREYNINFKPNDILNIKLFNENRGIIYIFFNSYIIIYNLKYNTKRIIKFDSNIKSFKIYFDIIFVYESNGNFNILNLKGGKYKLELLKHKASIGQKFNFIDKNLSKKFTFKNNIVTFYNFDKKYEIKLFYQI